MGCILSGTGACDVQQVCVDTLTSPLHPIPLGPLLPHLKKPNALLWFGGVTGLADGKFERKIHLGCFMLTESSKSAKGNCLGSQLM